MANPRIVFVDVYIDDPTNDPPEFRVELSAKNNPQLPTQQNPANPDQPEIVFHNDHHPGFEIHFELKGNTHGYFFPPPSQMDDAVWSKCGTVCPMGPRAIHDVFRAIRVDETGYPPERRILIVRNNNPEVPPGSKQGQGKFMYNLRVTNGTDWRNLDPPGDNTNGSWGFYSYSTTQSFLVAGAVATAAFVAVTSLGLNLVDDDVSLGIALLAAVTFGFAIAALWERRRES